MGTSLMFVLLLIASSRRQQWPQLGDVVKPFGVTDLLDRFPGPAPPCTIAARSRAFVDMLSFSVSISGTQAAEISKNWPKQWPFLRQIAAARPSMELA
jgi:hypothetical protein